MSEHWLYAFVRARIDLGADVLVDAILAEERRRHPLTAIVVCPCGPCNIHFTGRGERALEEAVGARDAHLARGCPFDPFGPRR